MNLIAALHDGTNAALLILIAASLVCGLVLVVRTEIAASRAKRRRSE